MMFGNAPALAFYGDDFTGSTDALEVLTSHQLDSVLFLRLPTSDEIKLARERFAAIGIAGVSRARDVEWMDAHLPAIYAALAQTGAAVCHYKVCSTFDSSPTIGNIGHALMLGRTAFGMDVAAPVIVGAPRLRRYTAFGHLFAAAGAQTLRIDRHPTMSVHPVTPMSESDLRVHLSRQAPLRIGLVDIAAQQGSDYGALLNEQLGDNDAMLFDVLDNTSQARAGAMLWEMASRRSSKGALFCVGSSGVEYALAAHWASLWPERVGACTLSAPAVDNVVAISGSCSPVTADQIACASTDGFAAIAADAVALIVEETRAVELDRLRRAAGDALARGASPLIYSARGPADPAISRLNAFINGNGLDLTQSLSALGCALGQLLRELVDTHRIHRVVVAGGDTSGEVVQALDVHALQMKATLFPGAPLCAGYTALNAPPSIEIALKGGQMGKADYFQSVCRGKA